MASNCGWRTRLRSTGETVAAALIDEALKRVAVHTEKKLGKRTQRWTCGPSAAAKSVRKAKV